MQLKTRSNGRVDGIQYLRFVAAFLVVIHHAYKQVAKYGTGDLGSDFAIGAWGVDIFFVISGFIMLFITERRETSSSNFLSHRIARVAPMYWLATALMAVMLIATPAAFDHSAFDWKALIASLGFVAWPSPSFEGAAPVLQVGWTLNFEMFFYLAFALALAVGWKRRGLIAGGIIAVLIAAGLAFHPSGVRLRFYSNPIMGEFVAGLVLARLFISRTLPGPLASMAIVAVGVGLWIMTISHPPARLADLRPIIWGVPAAMIVMGVLGLELAGKVPDWRPLRRLGDASYSIYLTHFFTLGAVRFLWSRAHLAHRVTDAALLSISIGTSLAVGLGVFLWIEKPITRAIHAIMKRSTGLGDRTAVVSNEA